MSNSSVEDSGSRFSPVDDDHHGGLLWITASLSLIYFVFSCILRVILFYPQFTKDTICLVVATVCRDTDVILHPWIFWRKQLLTPYLGFWFHPSNACIRSVGYGLRHIN